MLGTYPRAYMKKIFWSWLFSNSFTHAQHLQPTPHHHSAHRLHLCRGSSAYRVTGHRAVRSPPHPLSVHPTSRLSDHGTRRYILILGFFYCISSPISLISSLLPHIPLPIWFLPILLSLHSLGPDAITNTPRQALHEICNY